METEYLLIRPIRYEDLTDVCEYGCDAETGKYMIHWPKTQKQIQDFIHTCVKAWNQTNAKWHEYVVILKEENRVIGNITLIVKENEGELGWISHKDYWGNGYMTEAVSKLMEHIFANYNITMLNASCSKENVGSYRVMEKCGMMQVGNSKKTRSVKNGKVVIYDKLLYSVSKPNH